MSIHHHYIYPSYFSRPQCGKVKFIKFIYIYYINTVMAPTWPGLTMTLATLKCFTSSMLTKCCMSSLMSTVVSTEPFSRRTGTLRCLQKEMATYRHWSVSLWQDPDDVPHCRILSPDKTEWQLISATLCRLSPRTTRTTLWLIPLISSTTVQTTKARDRKLKSVRWGGPGDLLIKKS